MEQNEFIVDLENLRVAYGAREILKDINLKIEFGQTVALAGANGSGKSTLLKSLVRLELADQGHGTVVGHSIFSDPTEYNEEIGYVSELLDFQVNAKLIEIAKLYEKIRKNFCLDEFNRVVELFELDVNSAGGEYSRGQKMQFAFALVVASKPKLILLDEVTAVLDIQVRDLVMREVQKLVDQGSTALIASNILTEVVPYADRLVILEEGQIKLDCMIEDLAKHYVKVVANRQNQLDLPSEFLIKGGREQQCTYLVPKKESEKMALKTGQEINDEPITAEDVFLYHCRRAG